MKICWDNIEGLRYSKKTGKWYKKSTTYVYKNACEYCGEPFLSIKGINIFCSKSCSKMGKNNSFYGKHHSEETKEKLRKSLKGKIFSKESIEKRIKTRRKNGNNFHSEETKKKISKNHIDVSGKNNPSWKGGYSLKEIPLYDTYAHKLEWCEQIRRNKQDPNILEIKCFKCDEWYIPTITNVRSRIYYLNGNTEYENRFYCSIECKNSCSIFGKSINSVMKGDAVRAGRLNWLELYREMQPELRRMVLERDKNQCVKCGSIDNLQCHHIYPVSTNPLESADIDNCMTLCYTCHKKIHQEVDGCKYNQLKTEIC